MRCSSGRLHGISFTGTLIADCCVADHVTCYRRSGIEARRKIVQPVGAWFSQIGRLHQVYHLWQYPCVSFRPLVPWELLFKDTLGPRRNLETRKEMRENSWQLDGWAGTVHKARLQHLHLFVTRLT